MSIDEKLCKVCGITKPFKDMYRPKTRYLCKMCRANKRREDYFNGGKDQILKKQKEYYQQKGKIQHKKYKRENKEKIKDYMKEYIIKNKEKIQAQKHSYNIENRESVKEYNKKYKEENREIIHRKTRERYQNDVNFRLKHVMRSRIKYCLHKIKSESISKNLVLFLGCSIEELKTHLEKQFQPGMTWDNHGNGENEWSIDHIIPCSSFDHSIFEEIKKCHHYTNLRPLWHIDNLRKSDTLIDNNLSIKTD